MALLIEHTPDVASHVADQVAAAYTARRERVRSMPLSDLVSDRVVADLSEVRTLVATDMRVVEIVTDDHVELERLAAAAWALAGLGWDVTVLVPCDRVGDAHASLRSTPCLIQPWWVDGDGVWFGAHETP